jgi:hypothetical protein
MAQRPLCFQYEQDHTKIKMTALGGLPVFLDLMNTMGVFGSLRHWLDANDSMNGWSVSDVMLALVMVNLAGGDCVEDLNQLNADVGFARMMGLAQKQGYSRQQRRALQRKLAKLKMRALPSKSSAHRGLERFHDPTEELEKARRREEAERTGGKGKAYVQKPNRLLRGLQSVIWDLLESIQRRAPQPVATLDQDATLVRTHKADALYCYKKFKAYQPLNTYWAEQGLVVHSEFRDGNVPAGFEQLRVLRQVLKNLPDGVEKVYLRSDTAGYQQDLLQYCAEGKNERFGVVEFAVGADVTDEFKKAVCEVEESDWKELKRRDGDEWVPTGQQWAEVCYVPKWAGHKKHGPEYRFLATREPLRQMDLPGMEKKQGDLPFPTMEFNQEGRQVRHKVFGVVTNRDLPGDELIWWHRKRCGYSEQVHAVMKSDLAGGRLPSEKFGANAAWWQVMVLALNLTEAMKRLVLGGEWVTRRMKAIRFHLIHVAGRVVDKGRQVRIRLSQGHPAFDLLNRAREKIAQLVLEPTTS